MLVLSRRPKETILIGDNIKITVLSISGSETRIGISAPKTIPVHREEIYKKIQKKKASAEQPNEADVL